MITNTKRFASYHATDKEWTALADEFEQNSEKRLAATIRDGIKRQQQKEKWRYGEPWSHHCLRFRDGSIAKMDVIVARQIKEAQ